MSTEVIVEDKEVRKIIDRLIKNVGQISEKGRAYVGLLSSIVYQDIIDHFEKEEGPSGKWKPWSKRYSKYMASIGKANNLILQDTGRLRQGWQPARYRLSREGVLWFNPVSYAAQHDEGIFPYPQRKFSWLSDAAIKSMEEQTLKFIENTK